MTKYYVTFTSAKEAYNIRAVPNDIVIKFLGWKFIIRRWKLIKNETQTERTARLIKQYGIDWEEHAFVKLSVS